MPDRPGAPIGIAAGGGVLPRIVAEAAAAAGWRPIVLAIGDAIDADWAPFTTRPMPWGRLADGIQWLRQEGVDRLVLCGTVSKRPDFRSIIPSVRTLMMLPEILSVVRGGDDHLLRAATRSFERRGLRVVAVQDIAPILLAADGHLAGPDPQQADIEAVDRAFRAALTLGALDVGQAAVASKDRVIALEGIEGTREMLERVADLRRRGRIGRRERCVLVKARKPQQDTRFDLPSIGVGTVNEAEEAGIVGIAVSAGGALLLGIDDIREAADRTGIFVLGSAAAHGGQA